MTETWSLNFPGSCAKYSLLTVSGRRPEDSIYLYLVLSFRVFCFILCHNDDFLKKLNLRSKIDFHTHANASLACIQEL